MLVVTKVAFFKSLTVVLVVAGPNSKCTAKEWYEVPLIVLESED